MYPATFVGKPRAAAGVPPEVVFATKPEIAVALLRQMVAAGVAPAPVLGDEVDGAPSELRAALRELGLEYFLNAGGDLLAWTQAPRTRLAKKHWGLREGEPWEAVLRAIQPWLVRWLGCCPAARPDGRQNFLIPRTRVSLACTDHGARGRIPRLQSAKPLRVLSATGLASGAPTKVAEYIARPPRTDRPAVTQSGDQC